MEFLRSYAIGGFLPHGLIGCLQSLVVVTHRVMSPPYDAERKTFVHRLVLHTYLPYSSPYFISSITLTVSLQSLGNSYLRAVRSCIGFWYFPVRGNSASFLKRFTARRDISRWRGRPIGVIVVVEQNATHTNSAWAN